MDQDGRPKMWREIGDALSAGSSFEDNGVEITSVPRGSVAVTRTMRWCFQNAAHPYADSVLEQLAIGAAIVPVLWRYEVSAVLAKSQKDGILTALRVDEFLATLKKLNITVDPDSSERILSDVHRLAIAYRLTSYDASYLEVALRKNLPLATLDHELIAACKASGVALITSFGIADLLRSHWHGLQQFAAFFDDVEVVGR